MNVKAAILLVSQTTLLSETALLSLSLHQNVSHGFNAFISIIWPEGSCISTSVEVIRIPSCTKPDSGIRARAIIFLVTKDADS